MYTHQGKSLLINNWLLLFHSIALEQSIPYLTEPILQFITNEKFVHNYASGIILLLSSVVTDRPTDTPTQYYTVIFTTHSYHTI